MASPFPRLTPPQFGNPGLATQALIRVAKPSYTTGTLGEMYAKIFRNIFNKNMENKIKKYTKNHEKK
jgi:hypothetical protein